MSYNLAAPENAARAMEVECQKRAALWVYHWQRGKMTRGMIDQAVANLTPEQQNITKRWLNIYRERANQKGK